MNLPASVDLRSGIDSVYDQETTNACGAHAVINALEAALDPTGLGARFSRAWLWWWVRVYTGQPATNTGSTVEAIHQALKVHGAVTEDAWPWHKAFVTPPDALAPTLHGITYCERTPIGGVSDIKRLLALGVAPVLLFVVKTGLMSLSTNRDWRTHDWDINEGSFWGEHFVTIVGYDDAAQRFLVENSWGPGWADGGFFGIPYDKIFTPGFYANISHIDHIEGVALQPVDGFMSTPTYLNPIESSGFVLRSQGALKDLLTRAYASGGVTKLVNTCKEWGVSDKHLEILVGWPRGEVRKFRDSNPDVDWVGFQFDTV